MEPAEFRMAQKMVEDMPHLVEEGNNVVMPHQSWFIWRGFRQVGYHRSERETALARRQIVTPKEGPNCGMGVLER
jgi:hypothetical protein